MGTLIAFLLVAAAPCPVSVTVVNDRPGTDALSREVARQLVAALENAGASASFDATTPQKRCRGGRVCIRAATEALPAGCVLAAIDIGLAGRTLAAHFEALTPGEAEPFATSNHAVPVESRAQSLKKPLDALVGQIVARLRTFTPEPAVVVPAPAPDDAPRVATLVPAPVNVAVEPVATMPGSPGRRVAAISTTVLAGASIAVSAGLLAWAGVERGRFQGSVREQGNETLSSLTPAQAGEVAGRANAASTGALVAGLTGAALAGVATWLWATLPD